MKIKFIAITLIISQTCIAQVASTLGFSFGKEFSKDISVYRAKEYLITHVLESSMDVTQFEVDALAASSSGEITSLVYKCKKNSKEGLLLGFYGDYWNDAGVVYQGYDFKNLPVDKAFELLKKISKIIEDYGGVLGTATDNNIYFKYDDLTVLLYYSNMDIKIRIFWKTFDAEWESIAFKRTLKRFEKRVD